MSERFDVQRTPNARFEDADLIWNGGASNPRAVARALVRAIDESSNEGCDERNDPAVQMILDHLCFLCGLPQPSFSVEWKNWDNVERTVAEKVQSCQELKSA